MAEVQSWKHTYPTIAALQEANIVTCIQWFEHLPLPQTDVEHTVYRRLMKRLVDDIKMQDPKVHAGIEKLRDTLKKAGIKVPGNLFDPGD